MATIKSYTDIEQSKKLIGFLPFESADKVHHGIHLGIDGEYHLSGDNTENDVIVIDKEAYNRIFGSEICNQLPCWSLTALINVLPQGTRLLKSTTDETYHCDCPKGNINKWFDNSVDAAFEIVCWLKENDKL